MCYLDCRLSHLEHCFSIEIRSTNIFMFNRPERKKIQLYDESKNGQLSRASIFLSQGRRNVWEQGDLSPPRIDRISIFHCTKMKSLQRNSNIAPTKFEAPSDATSSYRIPASQRALYHFVFHSHSDGRLIAEPPRGTFFETFHSSVRRGSLERRKLILIPVGIIHFDELTSVLKLN